jgi:hypothetical protein
MEANLRSVLAGPAEEADVGETLSHPPSPKAAGDLSRRHTLLVEL